MFSSDSARKYHLSHLLLWDKPKKCTIKKILSEIGYIQLDTISVITRSHNLVVHSRSANYQEGKIWELQERGEIFEEFAHARCLLLKKDFKNYYAKMILRRDIEPWWQQFLDNNQDWLKQVMNKVEDQGEITTFEVPIPDNFPKSPGWNRPNKRLLDYLSTRGYLMVKRRENFTKIYYDLPERVLGSLPSRNELPDRMDLFWFDIKQTLQNLGMAPIHRLLHYRNNHRYFQYKGKKIRPRTLIKKAADNGELEEIEVKGYKTPWYTLPGFESPSELTEEKNYVFLLSPFDNALWSREELLRQYGFDYKLESYTPKNKRVYGFYSLPILYGLNFVGRVDPKLDRDNMVLHMKSWNWEPDFKPTNQFFEKLATTLIRFQQFHGADIITLGDLKPSHQKTLCEYGLKTN